MANETTPAADRPSDNRGSVIIGVVASILPFTTAIVALRLYTRRFLSNGVGVDDWATVAALIFTILVGAIMCVMTKQGLGEHSWMLSKSQLTSYYKTFYLSIIFYDIGLGAVKLAILLLYLRVFTVKIRKLTIIAMVFVTLWTIALVLRSIFTCIPVEGFWDHNKSARCLPSLPRWYIDATGNIVTDIAIFILPIPVLWKLSLPLSQRLSLIGIFCLGFFTCAISVIRITFLDIVDDDTYNNVGAAGWSVGELCCGIICCSLGTLRPLFFRLVDIPRRTQTRSGGSGKYRVTHSEDGRGGIHGRKGMGGGGTVMSTTGHPKHRPIIIPMTTASIDNDSVEELMRVETVGRTATSPSSLDRSQRRSSPGSSAEKIYMVREYVHTVESPRSTHNSTELLRQQRDEGIGLRHGTVTSIRASHSPAPTPNGVSDPMPLGIHIKREINQAVGPADHDDYSA